MASTGEVIKLAASPAPGREPAWLLIPLCFLLDALDPGSAAAFLRARVALLFHVALTCTPSKNVLLSQLWKHFVMVLPYRSALMS